MANETVPSATVTARLSHEQLAGLLGTALLIRRVEEQVSQMVGVDFGGTTHFCIGQELAAVGACAALRPDDWVFSTHRNRAHVLARGADPNLVMAELLGKESGYSKGKGGSFHVTVPELGMPATSAIVAGNLPLALGAGLGVRLEGAGRVAVAFTGDRAVNEGAFHETLNLAALWSVPLLIVCENNNAVPYAPRKSALAMPDVTNYAAGYGLHSVAVDGGDLEMVWREVAAAVQRARGGDGPTFIESRTHRGPIDQSVSPALPCGPFNPEEAWEPSTDHPMPEWRSVDPLLKLAADLVDRGIIDRPTLRAMDNDAREKARKAADFARSAPYPDVASALEDVYA